MPQRIDVHHVRAFALQQHRFCGSTALLNRIQEREQVGAQVHHHPQRPQRLQTIVQRGEHGERGVRKLGLSVRFNHHRLRLQQGLLQRRLFTLRERALLHARRCYQDAPFCIK